MSAVVARFMTASANLWKASGAVLSADSALLTAPIRFTLDQLRTKAWRSDGPWVIVSGWNDKIDFERSGTGALVATLTAGIYSTGTALAAEIQTRMNAVDPGWTVTYSTATNKFTFANADVTSTLRFATGANAATSPAKDLGFNVADVSGTSIVSDNVAFQSRHFLAADLGSAQAHTVAIALGHNLDGGTITLKGSNTSVLHALTAGTSQALSLADANVAYAYFGSQSFRYVVFLIDDVGNADAFAEMAVPYVGTFVQPSIPYDNTFRELGEDLSVIQRSADGANFGDLRPENPAWDFRYADASSASGDLALFQALRAATRKGLDFFLDFDAGQASPTTLHYGFRISDMPIPTTSGNYYSPAFTFAEALG